MRFAVYVAPPPDEPLAGLAASWLGRDAWTGHAVERPAAVSPGPAVVARLTAEPRRYGFHGTMKPPFRLAADLDAPRLRGTFADFCEGRAPVRIAALRLARIGEFFALVPDGDAPALDALAADVVRAFDAFRAPATAAETARRRPERLSPRQRGYLETWGYPYVFEEFRFHMTLTGPVPEAEQGEVERVLQAVFAPVIGKPLAVDALCLFVEPDPPGDFVVDMSAPLAGG